MKKWLICVVAVLALSAPAEFKFNREKSFAVPKTFPAGDLKFNFPIPAGIRPIIFEGEEHNGYPSKIFAWYGMPQNAKPPYPALVLVHGGGGTAFTEWVRRWNERGFAAIAIDTQGCVPTAPWEGMSSSVPLPGGASKVPMMRAGKDASQLWLHYGVTAAIRAHSLLRTFPEIDKKRIGIIGISWGGVITELTSSVDDRFQYAVPVYASGYLDETLVKQQYVSEGAEAWKVFFDNFDPSLHLVKTTIPVLFLTDCDDACFYMSPWLKTIRLPKGKVYCYAAYNFSHSHDQGDHPEVLRFARAMTGLATMPPAAGKVSCQGNVLTAEFVGGKAPFRAELIYTTEKFEGKSRIWRSAEARVVGNRISAAVPTGATEAFFNLFDAEGAISLFPEKK